LYKLKKEDLDALKHKASSNKIDLIYFDESGFNLNPNLPYAWSKVATTLKIESKMSSKLNVLGFLNINNSKLFATTTYSRVDSDMVIATFNEFMKQTIRNCKKTIIVVDNASFHTSKKFKDMLPKWNKKGVEIFYLPPYSPELNPIEILWKFMKYHWIDFKAYKSTKNMRNYVENIIINYGKKYEINFK